MWPSVLSQGRSVPLPVPSISRMQRSPQDRNRLRPLARPIPPGSPHRSMSASTTRPVQHSAPLLLSIFARPHQNGLIRCWRADSLGLCLALDPGITPCCKSPKLPGANFPAEKKPARRPPIDVASITLPGSPASFSSDDEVPHIFTCKSPVQPKEILIASFGDRPRLSVGLVEPIEAGIGIGLQNPGVVAQMALRMLGSAIARIEEHRGWRSGTCEGLVVAHIGP